ncbi:MAG TPA: ribosome silencing factor [Limnochordales bacterium]
MRESRRQAGLSAEQVAVLAARAADERKALDVSVLDLRGLSPLADFFVLSSGQSTPQVRAIAEHVERSLSQAGLPPPRWEGTEASRWILLDYGDVVVHVFHHAEREFYNLEALWDRAPRLAVDLAGAGSPPGQVQGGSAERALDKP